MYLRGRSTLKCFPFVYLYVFEQKAQFRFVEYRFFVFWVEKIKGEKGDQFTGLADSGFGLAFTNKDPKLKGRGRILGRLTVIRVLRLGNSEGSKCFFCQGATHM